MIEHHLPDPRLVALGRKLHVLGAVIACALLGGGLYFVQRALAAERVEIHEKIEAAEGILRNEATARAENERLTKQLERMERRTGELLARIPRSPREGEFLEQLTELADQSHLKIRNYRPGDPKFRESHSELDIDFVAEGDFNSLCTFLEGLQRLPRLCRINRLEVQAAEAQVGAYPITMQLRIFFKPGEEKWPQPDSANQIRT